MSSQWYYQHAGQQLGPISFEQLQIFGASGQLLRTDLVWTEGMADWGEAGETGDIFGSQFQSFSQPAPQQSMPQQMPPQSMPQQMPQPPAHQSAPQQLPPQQLPLPPHTGQPMMPELYAPQQPFLQEPTPAQPQPAAPMQEPYPQQPFVQEPTPAQQKPAAPKQQWYFMKGDERCGPISTKQLKRRAANGKLRPTDIVWTEGLDEWIPATKVMGLSFPEPQKNTGPRPIPVSKQGGGL